jgi:putative ABC transport system permease protein
VAGVRLPLIGLAWRNLWRNKRRTILTVGAISLYGFLFLWYIWLSYGAQESMLDSFARILTGHIQIHAKGFSDDMSVMKRIPDPQPIIIAIEKEKHVTAYSARIKTYALAAANETSSGAFVLAIDPEREKSVSNLYKTLKEGRYLSSDAHSEIVIGYVLAENLGVKVGDKLALLVQAADGSMGAQKFTVVGLVDPGMVELNNSLLLMHLGDAQTLLSYGSAVNEITVMVDDLGNVDEVRQSLWGQMDTGKYEILTWNQVSPELEQLNSLTWAKFILLMSTFALVAALGVMNTVLMSAMERVREFGIMMAMGVRPGQVTRLIITESLMITLLSIVIGFGMATVLGFVTENQGISMKVFGAPDYLAQFGLGNAVLFTKVNWQGFVISLCTILGMGFLASLYPAIRTGRMKPMSALKYT